VKSILLDSAYKAGRRAYMAGEAMYSNPYLRQRAWLSAEWLRGYRDARDEDQSLGLRSTYRWQTLSGLRD
jgi:ribosome modulation factor